jgi:coronin-7
VNEDPFMFYCGDFKTKDPQSGVTLLPKANDVTKNEIIRLAKITPNGHIMPVKFEVPRQDTHHFQDDLFPDTFDNKPSLSSSEWFSGENKPPVMRSQKP